MGVFGFWALLICFFASSMELFLGISFWFILIVTIRRYLTVGSLPPSYQLTILWPNRRNSCISNMQYKVFIYSVDAKTTNFRLTSGLQNLENFISGFHAYHQKTRNYSRRSLFGDFLDPSMFCATVDDFKPFLPENGQLVW